MQDGKNDARTEDFLWFVENYKSLYEKYGLCYLAVKDKTILGSYDNPRTAVDETCKTYPHGSFIVQLCNGRASGYTNFIANSQLVVV